MGQCNTENFVKTPRVEKLVNFDIFQLLGITQQGQSKKCMKVGENDRHS